jgi:hypothetical protein
MRLFSMMRDYRHSKLADAFWDLMRDQWEKRVKPTVPALVQFFSAEGDRSRGKKEEVVEIKLSHATYFNRSGMSSTTFKKYAGAVDQVLGTLKGWRRKALKGSLKVVFVGAQQMKVQGKYRQATDELWVRATPKVLRRDAGTYGGFDYIIVHELGHRYERYNSLPTVGFDRDVTWRTTRYSYNDGEAFAELFALSHFKIKGTWGKKLEAFETVMEGRVPNQKSPEVLPPHLRALVARYRSGE